MSVLNVGDPAPFPAGDLDKPVTNAGLMHALNNHAADMRRIVDDRKDQQPPDIAGALNRMAAAFERMAAAMEGQ